MSSLPLIIGHRGASYRAPENTLPSFQLAFREGADGVEADFRLTQDGEIVCLHDDSTRRTVGADLKVCETTLAELRRLDAGSWKGEGWAGAAIPTLGDVLAMLPQGKRLFIELKGGRELLEPLEHILAASAVSPAQIRILSFNAELVRLLKDQLPGYRSCWLTDYSLRGSWRPSQEQLLATLEECGAHGLASRDRAVLDEALVAELRKRSLEIHVWTVDAARAARRLQALGVDSIMTNKPGFIRRSLAGDKGEAA
jgi:glycerophosphoryl diester phosphodiesterase